MGQEAEWLPGADPDKPWKTGLMVLTRVRWIATIAIADTIGFGALWKYVDLKLAGGVLVGGIFLIVALSILHFTLNRACHAGDRFHRLCHSLREACHAMQSAPSLEIFAERFGKFHGNVAEDIAEFFRSLTGDATINCAIRLAGNDPEVGRCYVTVGRSRGMDSKRDRQSKPIPADRGVPHFLRTKGEVGVCFINSIAEAGKSPAWYKTPNDELSDVNFLAIAPINAYEHGKKSMLGMLCVTSRRHRVGHLSIEPLKGFADMLGLLYPAIQERRVGSTEAKHERQVQ